MMTMMMMMIYDLYNNDSSPIIDPEVCLLTCVVLVFKPRELEIKVFTYAEDFSVIPTSKKLQFDVVTQLAPAIFISLCITASLFLSVSNENILLSKTKKGKEYVKYICSTMFCFLNTCTIKLQVSLGWNFFAD